MSDLDPALVDTMCIEAVGGPHHWHPLGEWAKDTTRTRIRAALLSLGIPAAALNALAKGEAVVVPKVRTREMVDARRAVYSVSPITDAHWQFVVDERNSKNRLSDSDRVWDAELSASPYRSGP